MSHEASGLEAAAIQRAQDGHRSAMGQLFEEYSHFLLAIIGKLMGPELRRTLEPADVLQETLLVATARFEDFHGNDDHELRAWLAALARRTLVDLARHNGRLKRALKGRISLDTPQTFEGETLVDLLSSSQCTASQIAVKGELADRLAKAMTLIDPREATVLQMRYVDGLSLEAIGQQIGTGRHGVAGIVARGLQNLRRILPS